MSHYLNCLLLSVSVNLLGKRQWYLRHLGLITNWMNHPVFPFNATFYLIAAISKWLSVGLLPNASLKIRRVAGGKIHAGLQQEAGLWCITCFSYLSLFFHLGLLIKGHLFSSEAATTNTQAGCFFTAHIQFFRCWKFNQGHGVWFLVVEALPS